MAYVLLIFFIDLLDNFHNYFFINFYLIIMIRDTRKINIETEFF
jgi:hypothetical protein